jgi:hypothetical protein
MRDARRVLISLEQIDGLALVNSRTVRFVQLASGVAEEIFVLAVEMIQVDIEVALERMYSVQNQSQPIFIALTNNRGSIMHFLDEMALSDHTDAATHILEYLSGLIDAKRLTDVIFIGGVI